MTASTHRRWTKARRERDPVGYREWLLLAPRRKKDTTLRKRYGITVDQFDAMVEAQGGVCAMCHEPPTGRRGTDDALHVDHDHDTGRVRGLVCARCNWFIGLVEAGFVEKALAYLGRQA